MADRIPVVVIGAGITGLALGYNLRRAGVRHVVLEASDRVGGVIRSGRVDGSLLEWGPQRTRLTPSLQNLLQQLGIAGRVVTAPAGLPLFVYRDGRLRKVPFSVLSMVASDIVPFRSKVRLLLEPLTRAAEPDESVAAYFTRKLGRRMYENVAGPLYGGLYASDPADMVVGFSLGHVLSEFRVGRSLVLAFLRRGGSIDPPAACSFEEGLEELPRALHAANRENVRLATPALGLSRVGEEWEVSLGWSTVRARHVVVTAPADRAADLLVEAAPRTAAAAAALRYNPLAVVHLRAETDLQGLGYQVSLAERLATRGVTFNDALFDRRGIYTAYLGGSRNPQVVDWPDRAVAATAEREFEQVTGFAATTLSVARERMPAWDSTWAATSRIAAPPGLHLAANWESRPGIPGRLAQAKRLADELARSEFGTPVSDV